jgi:hypothetical protein
MAQKPGGGQSMAQFPQDFDSYFISSRSDKQRYYIDTIYNYVDPQTMQAYVNMEDFLKGVDTTKINILKRDKRIVADKIAEEAYRSLSTTQANKDALKPAAKAYTDLSSTFDNADEDTLIIDYTPKENFEKMTFDSVMASMFPQPVGEAEYATKTKNHKLMSQLLHDTITNLCKWKYTSFRTLLASADKSKFPADIQSALIQLTSLGSKEAGMLTRMNDVCSEALASFVERKDLGYFMMEGVNETGKFGQPINYKLREAIYNKIALREIQDRNDNVYKYAKRIAAEMYLISYFPYVHFLYIEEMLKRFKKNGDFVNMRAGLTAKVMYIVNTLDMVYSMGVTVGMTAAQGEQIKRLLTALQDYSAKLKRVDFNNESVGLGDIMIDIHDKSKSVVQKSMTIDEVKSKITDTQIQIRALLTNFQSVNKAYDGARLQFNLLVAFLVILIVVSAVLLSMRMYVDELSFALMGIICIVITFKIITTIISLVKM